MLSYYVPDEERDVIQHVNQNKESSKQKSTPSVFKKLALKFNSGLQQPNVSKASAVSQMFFSMLWKPFLLYTFGFCFLGILS